MSLRRRRRPRCPRHPPVRRTSGKLGAIMVVQKTSARVELSEHNVSITANEVLAIKEAVADFIAWTLKEQARTDYRWGAPFTRHPGVNSPKLNPDYEWLHRQTWIHED